MFVSQKLSSPQSSRSFLEQNSPSRASDAAGAPTAGDNVPSRTSIHLPSDILPKDSNKSICHENRRYAEPMEPAVVPTLPTKGKQPDKPFADRIYMSFATNPQSGKDFLPRAELHNLIQGASVMKELEKKMPSIPMATLERLATTICGANTTLSQGRLGVAPEKSYLKIFAILALINMVPAIEGFVDEGICDADLPLIKASEIGGLFELRVEGRSDSQLKSFESWTTVGVRNFEEYQWIVLSPIFTKRQPQNVEHYELGPHIVLPFISAKDNDDPWTEIHRGGFSRVLKAEIHPAHHEFSDSVMEPSVSPQMLPVASSLNAHLHCRLMKLKT